MSTMKRKVLTGLVVISLGSSGCAVNDVAPTGDYLPKSQWASIDGNRAIGPVNEDIYGWHRVTTLNGHDLYDGRKPRKKDQKTNCLLRDCKLFPGSHSIEVEYGWNSRCNQKSKERRAIWKGLGYAVLVVGGAMGGAIPDIPSNPGGRRDHPCHAQIAFEVQAKHEYAIRVVHTNLRPYPEEFQIVDLASDAVVGSAEPSCY